MKRGWCPTVHEPMPTGDGLLVRVKPFGGRVTSDELCRLTRAVTRCGGGIVELTSRGNFQVRGLDATGARQFAAAMVAAGLASADPLAERRRNVMVSPLAGADPTAAADAIDLAALIETMLVDEAAMAGKSPKFAVAVDGGGVLPLAEPADIVVRSDGARHWIEPAPARRETLPAGFFPYPGGDGGFGIGLPFGQTDAITLAFLAALADRFADGVLRTSPWRALMVGRVRARDVPALREVVARRGLIGDPDDRRLRMAACIGSAGCASGTVRARDDAATLVAAQWDGFLHVSGCAKGCAHPTPATTLVGNLGQYDLVRHGRAGDFAEMSGLTLAQAAAAL